MFNITKKIKKTFNENKPYLYAFFVLAILLFGTTNLKNVSHVLKNTEINNGDYVKLWFEFLNNLLKSLFFFFLKSQRSFDS